MGRDGWELGDYDKCAMFVGQGSAPCEAGFKRGEGCTGMGCMVGGWGAGVSVERMHRREGDVTKNDDYFTCLIELHFMHFNAESSLSLKCSMLSSYLKALCRDLKLN